MIETNLCQTLLTIKKSCQLACRDSDTVLLLAVSKRQSCDNIYAAYHSGQRAFGENYLHEALEKMEFLKDLAIDWHFIGQIQSNKTRKIAENFSWAHTVSSYKIAKRLSEQRPNGLPDLNICIQINIDNEYSKAGIAPELSVLEPLAREIAQLPKITLRGLMCIPAPKSCKAEEIATFTIMQNLHNTLNQKGIPLDTLSMGMSGDLDTAIQCGATIARVGTAIFGERL